MVFGVLMYGVRMLDDWVFEMNEDGMVRVVDVRMLRVKLEREG